MEIVALPPDAAEAEVEALHRLYVRCAEDIPPHGPVPSLLDVAGRLRPSRETPGDLLVAPAGDGRMLGAARVRRPAVENQYLLFVDVVVDPAERRRGVGTRLLAAAVARADGRRLVMGEVMAGGPGDAFAARFGGRALRADLWQRLDLAAAAAAAGPVVVPPGYTLRSFLGRCPPELLDSYARCKQAMADAPMGDLEADWPAWSPERVRADEAAIAARGKQLRDVVAVDSTGTVAGLTEVFWQPGWPLAQQGDTAVRPEHRGHGLGLLLKSAMVNALPPELTAIDTWNTATNEPMLRVNRALGFHVVAPLASWEAPTDEVLRRLR